MSFTTEIFFFAFLPACLLAYFASVGLERLGAFGRWLQKIRFSDMITVLVSLVFYSFNCFDNILRLPVYVFLVYLLGCIIEKCRTVKQYEHMRILATVASLTAVIFILAYTKYWGTVTAVWQWLFQFKMPANSIVAPLGISFLTFSAVSYLADISSGKATSGSMLDCLLYLTFFPKIISGPTVLWRDFKPQIAERKRDLDGIATGFTRIMIGFVKKVLIADVLGACLAEIPGTVSDVPTAWIGALVYMLQIYFDFAGYSDMAIGLAKLFGIEMKENFNFPYCSTSVGEFWRRWHISLGTWFREYVYFPLGGSRKGLRKTLRNLGIVFLLTGIWHGNGWTYLIWGGINGAMVILERLMAKKTFYIKTPKVIKWMFTMAVTLLCWQIFRFGSVTDVVAWCKTAFGLVSYQKINTWQYYFDAQIWTVIVIGTLSSTVFGLKAVQNGYQRLVSTKAGYATQQLVLVLLFAVAILFMVSSGYSPFIYFQY